MYDGVSTSLYGIKKTLEFFGFKCDALEGTINSNLMYTVPFIVHQTVDKVKQVYHYVVVYKICQNKVHIMDPAVGKYNLSIEKFVEKNTGYYLFIKPTSNLKQINRYMIINKTLKRKLKYHEKELIFILILITATLFFDLLTFYQLKIILNYALTPSNIGNLFILIVMFFFVSVLKLYSNYLIYSLQIKINYDIRTNLNNKIISQFLSLPLTSFRRKDNSMILSLFQDVEFVSTFFVSEKIIYLQTATLLIIIYAIFLRVSPKVFIFLLMSNLLFVVLIKIKKKKLGLNFQNYLMEKDKFTFLVSNIFHNFESIKGYHSENLFLKNLKLNSNDFLETDYKYEKYKEKTTNQFSLIETTSYYFIFFLISILLIKNTSINSLGTFILLENLIQVVLKNEERLMLEILSRKEYKESVARLDEFLLSKSEKLLKYSDNIYPNKMNIEIKNLTFSYNSNPILKNITISIPLRSHILFTGQSGSGKSTLFKLLGRYLEPDFASIKIDDIDITHYNLENLRKNITYVTANSIINNGSLIDNITLGSKKNINKIKKVMKITGLAKILESKRLTIYSVDETELKNLSSGEKVRLFCARALYKESKVYLFDECFSNLDIESEREILKNIFTEYKDSTILYISHRLQNKDLFDETYELRKGILDEKK